MTAGRNEVSGERLVIRRWPADDGLEHDNGTALETVRAIAPEFGVDLKVIWEISALSILTRF